MPISRLGTSLGILTGIIFFIKKRDIKFSENTIKNIKRFKNDKKEVSDDHYQIIRIIRNALAHWSDSENDCPQIVITDGSITFISNDKDKKGKLEINSIEITHPQGVHFLIEDVSESANILTRKYLEKTS